MNTEKRIILEKGRGQTRKMAKLAYVYERESRYFAQVAESAKEMAAEELKTLGARDLELVFRGIWFTATRQEMYGIVYRARLVSRVLAPLVRFQCKDKDDLYREARKVSWEEFLNPKKTFSIFSNVSESTITHSNFAGLRVKDAIADYFRDRTNRRPSVDPENPWISLSVHLHRDMATISVDVSGGPLHKRGYREGRVSAPMQETVAAAILALSGWDGGQPLYDPMCGSGTLLCEALMRYCRIPAQVLRESFGFERLPDFDARTWEKVRADADDAIQALPAGLIRGSDIDPEAVEAVRTNLMGLHHGGSIDVVQADFKDLNPIENAVIITNPPYGIRMGADQDMNQFYKAFGYFLREKCKGCTAYVYFGEPKFIKKVPLAPTWKQPLDMGGLEGKLVKYMLN